MDVFIIASSLLVPSFDANGQALPFVEKFTTVVYGMIIVTVCGNVCDIYLAGSKQSVQIFILSKKYEEIVRGTVEEVIAHFETVPPKGEFVLILEGSKKEKVTERPDEQARKARIRELVGQGMPTKEIAKKLSEEWGENKKALSAEVLEMLE